MILFILFTEHVRVPGPISAVQSDAATDGHKPDADKAITGQQLPGPGLLKDFFIFNFKLSKNNRY